MTSNQEQSFRVLREIFTELSMACWESIDPDDAEEFLSKHGIKIHSDADLKNALQDCLTKDFDRLTEFIRFALATSEWVRYG